MGMTPEQIAARLTKVPEHSALRFSVCTIPGRKGYTVGWVSTDSEETARLLAAIWNERELIARGIKAVLERDSPPA